MMHPIFRSTWIYLISLIAFGAFQTQRDCIITQGRLLVEEIHSMLYIHNATQMHVVWYKVNMRAPNKFGLVLELMFKH